MINTTSNSHAQYNGRFEFGVLWISGFTMLTFVGFNYDLRELLLFLLFDDSVFKSQFLSKFQKELSQLNFNF
jgi:hypothetical protein